MPRMHAFPTRPEEVARLLEASRIAPTAQRVQIACALFTHGGHVSAEQVCEMIRVGRPRVSRATVYNTLRLFRERALVREVIVDPSKVFYDVNTTPHHHFYDVVSGSLTDIPLDSVSITGIPEIPASHIVEGVDVVIRTRPRA